MVTYVIGARFTSPPHGSPARRATIPSCGRYESCHIMQMLTYVIGARFISPLVTTRYVPIPIYACRCGHNGLVNRAPITYMAQYILYLHILHIVPYYILPQHRPRSVYGEADEPEGQDGAHGERAEGGDAQAEPREPGKATGSRFLLDGILQGCRG
jgi:hypothetical protein